MSSSFAPRLAILAAVVLQAIGKIAYGTWLPGISSALFVFISFTITGLFFLLTPGSRPGRGAPVTLLLLNLATALTFLCFFYALQQIEPAIVGAIEIGLGPVAALALAFMLSRERPGMLRVFVCLLVAVGCAVLSSAAIRGTGVSEGMSGDPWRGLLASAAAGIGAVLITICSKHLLQARGWSFGAVLAHRFYAIVPLALLFYLARPGEPITWSAELGVAIMLISIVGVLAPLYLLQVGIGRCDPYTVMVTMAALPVITFLIEGVSPAYQWSIETGVGLLIITLALGLDIIAPHILSARRHASSCPGKERTAVQ